MPLKATEVFTPGSFPTHTYVERSGERLEQALRDAIDTPGQVVSLVGPSKSGKTVLVERVVGRDSLITVTGAGIQSPDDIWSRVLDWMGTPTTQSKGSATSGKVGAEVGASGSASLLGLAKGTGEVKGAVEAGYESEQSKSFERTGLAQIVKEIGGSDFVVLVDDFHYMPRAVQSEAAKSVKEAVRLGVKVCTAAVRHRGDDLVRANPELRGRVRAVDLEYWGSTDLRKIATAGFGELQLHRATRLRGGWVAATHAVAVPEHLLRPGYTSKSEGRPKRHDHFRPAEGDLRTGKRQHGFSVLG